MRFDRVDSQEGRSPPERWPLASSWLVRRRTVLATLTLTVLAATGLAVKAFVFPATGQPLPTDAVVLLAVLGEPPP